MGKKDIGEKILESYNDVFADIVNVLLFNGKQVLKEDELENQASRSAYKMDGTIREIERDVVKRWRTGQIRVACIGIENQTSMDKDMPLRVLAYDAAEYRAQLNQKKQSIRYPVVTLVLHFDYKKRWNGPLNLCKCLNIPENFKSFVSDYKMNLFDVAFLSPEQVKQFTSDFRFVADYFVQMRTTGNYNGNHEQIRHVQETLNLMSVLTQDNRFETVASEKDVVEGKEIKTMCDVLDRMIEKGRAEGKAEGKAEGFAEGEIQATVKYVKRLMENMQYTPDQALDLLGIQGEERLSVLTRIKE